MNDVVPLVRCAYCRKRLPEPGNSHYIISVGSLEHEQPTCVSCQKRMKLRIVRLVRRNALP
jgi:hypothetical protein